MSPSWAIASLLLSGGVAGLVNAVAGGGPIITLASLTAIGLDPRIASMTSTVALSPGQILAGRTGLQAGPRQAAAPGLSPVMLATAAIGGGVGAQLLLSTRPVTFGHLAPWLVLFATGIYIWVNRTHLARSAGMTPGLPRRMAVAEPIFRKSARMSAPALCAALAVLGVYGGYFGGGNSFLVLSLIAVTRPGQANPVGLKNAAIAAMNCGACVVLVTSSHIPWAFAAPLATGGLVGSWLGSKLVHQVPLGAMRWFVIVVGLLLCAWLFLQR